MTSLSDAQRIDAKATPLVKQARARNSREPRSIEGRVQWLLAIGFVCVAAELIVVFPPAGFSPPIALALVLAYGLLSRIEYEVGSGYTVPTELVLVPMLFLLPPALVPPLVCAAFVLARLPDYLSGRASWTRVIANLADFWHVIGPALVFCAAGITHPSWGDWPLYLLALGAQFAFDFGASAARMWATLRGPIRNRLGGWWLVCAVDSLLAPMGLLAAFAAADAPYAFLLVIPFAGLFVLFTRERQAHIDGVLELSRSYRGTARLLGTMLEDSDAYTGSHSREVVWLALTVAERMGMDEDGVGEVELTALLHDVGKMAIPPQIVDKAGPLSDEEWLLMQTHTVEGQRMLDQVGGSLATIGRYVRASHERWDGGGYPDGLAAEEIPLAARIVSCCDAYHAMTSDRSYRAALPIARALAELRAGAGTQFDPRVAGELIALLLERGVARPATDQAPSGLPRPAVREATPGGELKAKAEHVAAVARATRRMSQETDQRAAREAICAAALNVSAATAAALFEPIDGELLEETCRAGDFDADATADVLRAASPMFGPTFLRDAENDPRAPRELIRGARGVCAHLEPIVRGETLLGVIVVTWRERRDHLPEAVAQMMTLLATDAAVALERTDLFARLTAAARTDELTGLLKRSAWDAELVREIARAEREATPLCVAMLDIDHFKRFNDGTGHAAGDAVLKEAATAWRLELRVTDQLGRWGGDEFMVLMPGCSLEHARDVVERLASATPSGQTCSAGVAEWDGGEHPDALMARADAALLAAKRRGRNRVALARTGAAPAAAVADQVTQPLAG